MVELVTEGFEQGFTSKQLAIHEQVAPLVAKQIECYQSVYGESPLKTVEEVIDDIHRRHQQALRKVKIIHPPTPEISLIYDSLYNEEKRIS